MSWHRAHTLCHLLLSFFPLILSILQHQLPHLLRGPERCGDCRDLDLGLRFGVASGATSQQVPEMQVQGPNTLSGKGRPGSAFPVPEGSALQLQGIVVSSSLTMTSPQLCFLAIRLEGKGLRMEGWGRWQKVHTLAIILLRAPGVENRVRAPCGKGFHSDPRGQRLLLPV